MRRLKKRLERGFRIPSGGSALDAKVSVEFDHGDFAGGSLDVGLDYPGIPLDDTDTPPQLYLSRGGLGLKLHPLTLSGTVGVGITPLAPPGEGDEHSFIFSLTGSLSVAFGAPVTVTLGAGSDIHEALCKPYVVCV